jgi:hypothetical protein
MKLKIPSRFKKCGLCFLLSLPLFATAKSDNKAKRIIVGYVENTKIDYLDFEIKAKLDSGAKTSSIHAEILEVKGKKSDEKQSVVFTIKTDKGKSKNFHKPIKRWTKIKKKKGGHIKRPVIEMGFCIAGQYIHGEVNLADRENYIYDALIGRNTLIKGQLIIDPSKTFTSNAICSEKQGKSS